MLEEDAERIPMPKINMKVEINEIQKNLDFLMAMISIILFKNIDIKQTILSYN